MKVRDRRASGKRVRQGIPARAVPSTPRQTPLCVVVPGAPRGLLASGAGAAELLALALGAER